MKIIYVEFVNHIKLGDVKLDINNSIISVMGKNGSGKSFLLSSLHPYGSSSRYHKQYPVKPGTTGYKCIKYQVDNVIYETIHEYIPKKNTHACKSYLNRIENGVKEELNPTGHVEFYRELVEKHLKFNQDTFDMGFISFKSNGITSTSGQARRSILESTVDMSKLNEMKKNVATLFADKNSLIRMMEQRKLDILKVYSKEDLEVRLKRSVEFLEVLKVKLKEKNEIVAKLDIEIEALNKIDVSYMTVIGDAIDILKKYNIDTVAELIIAHENYMKTISGYELLFDEYQAKLDKIITYKTMLTQIQTAEGLLNNANIKVSEFSARLSTYVKTLSAFDMSTIIRTLNRLADLDDLLSNSTLGVMSDIGIKTMLANKLKEYDEMQSRINKYKYYMSMSDGKHYSVNIGDNCRTCDLYSKFFESTKYLEEHKDKYETDLVGIQEINTDRNTIEKTLMIANDIWDGLNIDKLFTENTISIFGLDSIDSFIKYRETPGRKYLRPFITKLNDTYNEYNLSCEDVTNLTNKLADMKSNSRPTDEDETAIRELIENTKNLINNLQKIDLTESEKRILNSVPQEYRVNSDLKNIYETMRDMDSKLKDLEFKRKKEYNELVDSETRIDVGNKTVYELTANIKELEESASKLEKLVEDKQVTSRCREILEKRLPIILLENNLQYIQNIVNEILNDIQVPIQIELIANGTEIQIPCMVEETSVPDVSCLSAGETCIVSLLLNAAILNIIGYPILCLDEIDANLDEHRRKKFNNLIYTIMDKMNITQICCVSHNVSSSIDSATIIQIGDKIMNTLSQDIIKI